MADDVEIPVHPPSYSEKKFPGYPSVPSSENYSGYPTFAAGSKYTPVSPTAQNNFREATIEDDFAYGSSVAQAHISIRLGFLFKVYSILSIQLLATCIIAGAFLFHEPLNVHLKQSTGLFVASAVGSIVSLIALMCVRREVPANYFLLSIFTLCESILVAGIATQFETVVVLEAFAITASVTIALTIFTLQSTFDYSACGAGLFSMCWALLVAGIFQIYFQSEALELILMIGSAITFSLFIVVDTSRIMEKTSPENYMTAVIDLYLDIINLFLEILRIVSKMNDKKKGSSKRKS